MIKTAARRKSSFLEFPVIDPHFTKRDRSRFFRSKSVIYTAVARNDLRLSEGEFPFILFFYIYDGNRRPVVPKHNKIAHFLIILTVVVCFLKILGVAFTIFDRHYMRIFRGCVLNCYVICL